VQELSGSGTVTANMLNGSVVDERHGCECSTGVNSTFLSDGLGSTLALADSNGTVQTQYTYDAFGNATTSGTTTSNTSQYTGRENDGTGLHYYRARYYSPSLQRFISQDPLGFGGGDSNLYAYVGNSPTNFTDPHGTNPLMAVAGACLEGALVSVAMDAAFSLLAGRKLTFEGVTHSALMGCVTGMAFFGLGRLFGKLRGLSRGAREAGDGAGACFVAGTKVQTAAGEKNIEEVAAGDMVMSGNPDRVDAASSVQPVLQAVSRTFVREAPVVLDIHIGKTTITATPEHPFWVVGAGWTAAGELRRGSAVLTKDGIVMHVDSIERREGSFKVYNFEVANTHTYYVSALGILVHNTYRPPNLTPKGAKRPGAFNQAKRDAGIPTSQQPTAVRPNVDRMGNRVPGRQYDFDVPANGGGTRRITIRDDAGGHNFGPNNPQNRGPHFNGPGNTHYDY
jgi:RHS repeat-associated protein